MLLTRDSHKTYPVHARWMIRRDMDEVMNIEDESFEYPWGADDFIESLRQKNCTGMVATDNADDNKVLGFMVYVLHKNRIDLLEFAVSPEYCRRGIGTHMMDKLKSKLSSRGIKRLSLSVSERNLRAQLFFRSQDFRAVSILRGYYNDTLEDDAYLMQYRHKPAVKEPLESQNYLSKLKAYFLRRA